MKTTRRYSVCSVFFEKNEKLIQNICSNMAGAVAKNTQAEHVIKIDRLGSVFIIKELHPFEN